MSITTDLMDFPQKSNRSFFIGERGKGVYKKVCVEPILISLSPILIEFVMILVSPPHRHPLMICHQLMQSEYTYTIFIIYHYQECVYLNWQTAQTLMRRCLYMFLFPMHSACSTGVYFEFETSYAPDRPIQYNEGLI